MAWVNDNYIIDNNNGPDGDGGIDCYGVDQINVFKNSLVNTGESSIYTATPGCTHMAIWGNDIHNSNEWGIDVTLGASNVTIASNLVNGAHYATMVLWQVSNVTVQYNTMLNGNISGTAPCRSIVVDTVTGYTIDNTNDVDSGPLYCLR
ncbi:MAG TPA: right-handed parallel beta-helix repeat-containing protein [Rudaea sp.]|nr:right-handed parallel beta-helix repeat-containing protein [Rudaea sp.]